MSKYSLNIAIKYGETLREFSNKSEAEHYFISYKDNLLNRLKAISIQTSVFGKMKSVQKGSKKLAAGQG